MTRHLDTLRRLGLRFAACYIALYALVIPSTLGFAGLPIGWYDWLLQSPIRGFAALFHFDVPVVSLAAPSSDRFQLAQAALFVVIAAIATIVWSVVARTELADDDDRLHHRLRIVVRYLLAYGTIHFAIITALRYDLRSMTPEGLLTPMGERNHYEQLWIFLGWSWVFTTFFAIVETLGGVLLLRRKTTLLGAMIVGAVLSNVVILTFMFDVPGKSLSPHFMAMVGFLVLPDAWRLLQFHILGWATAPVDLGLAYPSAAWLRRNHLAVKAALIGLFVLSPVLLVERSRGYLFVPKRNELAGLYKINTFARDGAEIAPILGDTTRWWRAVVSDDATRLHVQLANLHWIALPLSIDSVGGRLLVGAPEPSDWRDTRSRGKPGSDADVLTFSRAPAGGLQSATGTVAGHRLAMTVERVDMKKQLRLYATR